MAYSLGGFLKEQPQEEDCMHGSNTVTNRGGFGTGDHLPREKLQQEWGDEFRPTPTCKYHERTGGRLRETGGKGNIRSSRVASYS